MQFGRKALVMIASFMVPVWLFTAALTASFILTFHSPARIKQWVSHSGIYNKVVDTVLSESQKTAKKGGDELPISNPNVQAAAQQAFSPQVLQHDAEQAIDGFYNWLQGKTPQPEFKIDLATPKKQFAQNIGDYLRERVKQLPPCGATSQVADDIFTLSCIPKGYDVNAEIKRNVSELANSKDFLGDPVITANDIKGDDKKPVFADTNVKQLPQAYQRASWTPWFLIVLAIGGASVIVFLNDNRRKGIKRVAIIFVTVGALLILFGAGLHQSAAQLDNQIHLQGAAAHLQPAVVSLIRSVSNSFERTYTWFGLVYALVGAGLFVVIRVWLKPGSEIGSPADIKVGTKPEKPQPKS